MHLTNCKQRGDSSLAWLSHRMTPRVTWFCIIQSARFLLCTITKISFTWICSKGSFQRNGLGWMSSEHASNPGTPFPNALAKLLWEITDHWATLGNKQCQPDPWWDPFAGRRKMTHKGARQFDKAATEQLLSAVEDEMMKSWWDSASECTRSKVCMPLLCACCVHVVRMLCARGYYACGLTDCSQAWKMGSTQVQDLCKQLSKYLD